MNKLFYQRAFLWLILVTLGGCVEPFELPRTTTDARYLVVDGYLDTSLGSCTVRLSNSIDMSNPDATPPTVQGTVVVETDNQGAFPLQAQADGKYHVSGIPLSPNTQYRLRVTTKGAEYVSDYVRAKPTPPIDKLGWIADPDGIQVVVSTQDPTASTRYYRWDYTETYQYTAGAASGYVFVDPLIYPDSVDVRTDNVYQCWKTEPGYRIILASSAHLNKDVIHEFPLRRFSKTAPQLRIRYSILVRQHAISQEEFNYWEMLRKNTESMGTLFDPQPTQVTGNIRSVNNAEEPVFGFFSAHAVQEKRLFINAGELPYWPGTTPPCFLDSVEMADLAVNSTRYLIYPYFDSTGMELLGYMMASPNCADCRLSGGGVNVAPDFWR